VWGEGAWVIELAREVRAGLPGVSELKDADAFYFAAV